VTRFTAEEWSLLAEAPLLAAMMVLAAGRGGSVRGTLAVARGYAEARERDYVPLVIELIGGSSPDLKARVREREALAREAPIALQGALALLARKGSEQERRDYARFVLDMARAAAQAGGGARKATLGEIASVLREGRGPPSVFT
jgi:hypothetical protein